MVKQQIEYRVLEILDRVSKNQPVEDDNVELKSIWVSDYGKVARQIAAHANAARGTEIIWLIGVDEKSGIKGVDATELSNWHSSIKSCFDEGFAPSMVNINVPYDGKTVVALVFETDRAPFVVKNKSGGQIEREVPWREGNSTRSATRADLLRLLVPIIIQPHIEILQAELLVSTDSESFKRQWELRASLYITPMSTDLIVLPFHKLIVDVKTEDSSYALSFKNSKLAALREKSFGNYFRHPGEPSYEPKRLSLTIDDTPNEILISGPGLMSLNSETFNENVPQDVKQEISASIAFTNSFDFGRPIKISFRMQPIDPEYNTIEAQWKYGG